MAPVNDHAGDDHMHEMINSENTYRHSGLYTPAQSTHEESATNCKKTCKVILIIILIIVLTAVSATFVVILMSKTQETTTTTSSTSTSISTSTSTSTTLPPGQYGDPCSSNAECIRPSSKCLLGSCKCQAGYRYESGSGSCVATRSCKDVFDSGDRTTGFKTILPDGINQITALCVMDIDGGGWTVIQKRESASNFYKGWQEYKDGFGDKINFWIGLENIHRLSSQGNFELRVDMKRSSNRIAAAKYQIFAVGSESALYRLTIAIYSYDTTYVDPGDSLSFYNGMSFSTYDRDNDLDSTNCAIRFMAGDWYRNCHEANLNGVYGNRTYGVGINWYNWTGQYESLIYTRMMIRPT